MFFDFCKARNEEKHQKNCVFYEDKSKFGALKSSTTKLFFEVKGKYVLCLQEEEKINFPKFCPAREAKLADFFKLTL